MDLSEIEKTLAITLLQYSKDELISIILTITRLTQSTEKIQIVLENWKTTSNNN